MRAARRRRRINLGYGHYTNIIGKLHEDYAVRILEEYVKGGIIKSVRRTEDQGYEDRSGIDIVIVDRREKHHFLQVKSSYSCARKFSVNHPAIPVVVVTSILQPRETIKERLEAIFPFLQTSF